MPFIRKFEDVMGWQAARKLVCQVYQLTRTGALSKDFGMRDQLQRASVPVMSNIAEGFDCQSQVEFARFLVIARRSAVEVQSLLYAAQDVGYIDETIFNQIYHQASTTKALIKALKHSLKTPPRTSS